MFKKIKHLLPIASIILLSTACNKNTVGTSPDEINFVNSSEKPVTVDIYSSLSDYGSNTNLLQRLIINGNANEKVSRDILKTGNAYYIDWYNDDYTITNWYNDDYPQGAERVRFEPSAESKQYDIDKNFVGYHRVAFLNGNNTQTEWVATGAYLYSSSTGYVDKWNELSSNDRFKRIIIKKDFTANYTYRDSMGSEKTMPLNFMVQYTESGFVDDVPYIEFKSGNNSIGNMIGGKLPTSTPPDYKSNSTDTVMAVFPDSDYQYLMIKQ